MSPTRSMAGRAALAVGLMIGFYALALAVVAGLLLLVYLQFLFGRVNIRLLVFSLLGAGVILWSVIPRPDRFVAPGPLLSPAEQPRLFGTIEAVAGATGQAMPAEVYLVPDINAWVTQRGGIMGFGSHRVMGIGLPLLQLLSVAQFRAVLAHEFGHYYGGDTSLGPWIYKTRAAIGRTLQSLDQSGSILHILFLWYGKLFMYITQAISRRQEYTADNLAARTVGVRALADGLRIIHGGAAAFTPYWQGEVAPVLNAGFRPPLVEGFRQFVGQTQIADAIARSVEREIAEGQADPYDTHPTLRERLAALGDPPEQRAPADDPPALSLLDQTGELELRLLATLAGDQQSQALQPVAWDQVGAAVYRPMWERVVQQNAPALEELTPAALPAVVRDPQQFAPRLYELVRANPSAAERSQQLSWLLSVALAAALAREGWALQALPGDAVSATRGEHTIRPFDVVQQLGSGELDAQVWQRQCEQLGIADLPIGVTTA